MAKRTARPGTRRIPKTLTGILASIALAVLAHATPDRSPNPGPAR